ncbi:guided entry of tail-anchored proteins factor 1-like [Saccostrea echinata]|uniref:guided entry of tail-anchored proteins factor 1-like n=1 Tax=Saccostrea echinata TaxID=191078 RepID=UPI002A830507|nr:guided entry of tail-anchored proteins factor 1-like [Saccostrea echinata]
MYLMIFIFIAVILFQFLPKYSQKISVLISKIVYKVTDGEINIRSEIKDLKVEQDTISMTEEFAKYAKIQRKIDKHTAEIKRLATARNNKIAVINIGVKVGIYVVQALTMLVIILTNRSEPLLMFPESWFYPFHKIVSFPTGVPGGLGVTCWIIACSTAVNKFTSLWSLEKSEEEKQIPMTERQPLDIPLD